MDKNLHEIKLGCCAIFTRNQGKDMDLYSILQDYRLNLFPGGGDLGHSVGLGAGGDVDVGFHGFVVGLGVSTHHQANTGTFHLFCQLSQRTHTD